MLLSDVIKVIGSTPLRDYPWGTVVVDTVNLFVDDNNRLTDDSDGPDVHRALGSLSDEVKDIVLRANLDTKRRCITAPVGGNMVIEYEEESDDTPEIDFYKVTKSPVVISVTMIVISIVCMAVVMTGTLSASKDLDLFALVSELLVSFLALP